MSLVDGQSVAVERHQLLLDVEGNKRRNTEQDGTDVGQSDCSRAPFLVCGEQNEACIIRKTDWHGITQAVAPSDIPS